MMRLGTHLECIGSLLGWHKGVRWKKTETHRKIIGGSRKAYRELGRFGHEVGARRKFARTSPMVSGRSLGTRREIAGGRP
ncbi:hypothetical protein B296_00003604 [Ensete ventricosum]|uniref:Uncharacterized protein n=1 Tax=Ensete ventricosum TaxID=4639 RepID=A0A426YHL5_ENSVE|nr:hypothetical protein B296_00003604 [Ensete ventricosum]